MKGVRLALPLFLAFALPVWGQDDYPKGELFAGYAFSHYTADGNSTNLSGWGASVSGNFTKNLGLTSDFTGVYGSGPYTQFCIPELPCPPATENLSAYYFLAGPRFTVRTHRAAPFAEALFGVATHNGKTTGKWSNFAMGFGGGVNVPLGKHLAYRVLQADYVPARRPFGVGGWESNLRLQTGLVFTFGWTRR